MYRFICALVLAGALALFPPSTSRSAEPVDVELVLLVDESGSIHTANWDLQTKGYAEAFRDKDVIKAIQNGPNGRIAVTMVYWSGQSQQRVAIPWTLLSDEASANAFADKIMNGPRRSWVGRTAVGSALQFGTALLVDTPFSSIRRVIDISGDGASNDGPFPAEIRDQAVEKGIVINGLAILETELYVDDYYKNSVTGGPGSFVIAVKEFKDFADAIRTKLILEMS